MWVKICANTNLDDALTAAQLGADAVGFVYARSKRQVVPEQAEAIVDSLPKSVEKVGVFSTDDPYEVEHFVACSGLTIAQLHRPFDAEMVRLLSREFGGKLKIIQTVSYEVKPEDRATADEAFVDMLQAVFAEPAIWAVLLDAARSGKSGGLGVAFDWKHVAELVRRAAGKQSPRIILAGGLSPDNVAEAIAALRPWGVDVASGVEASIGRKDWDKIRRFIANARGAA